jgi:hypothetical protein
VGTRSIAVLLICGGIFSSTSAVGSPVGVRHKEGTVHGFLVLSTLEGVHIAEGELTQIPQGNQITSRVTYHFKNGSLQDETTVFSQSGTFRLISYHLVQKGPAFKHATEISIAASDGQVTVRYMDDDDKEKTFADHLDLPADLANGLVPTLLKNLGNDVSALEVPMVVATPKPRLVKLMITAEGKQPFSLAGVARDAVNYSIKVDIGGIAGVAASVIGKEPPDSHVWILGGAAPAFVKSETLSYMGGPLWRTELLAPTWPRAKDETGSNP